METVIMMKNNEFHTVRGYQLQKKDGRSLTSAMEDYLEMIYRNVREEGYMRINTLAGLLNVRPSSATKMVQKLSAQGFLNYQKYGIIGLTEKGRELGRFLLERHNIIERFLIGIGISENLLKETELIEHNVSTNTLRRINQLNCFFKKHPEIIEEFEKFKMENNDDCSSR
jgi:Mn-dependent DtxR family transcriptional regulator